MVAGHLRSSSAVGLRRFAVLVLASMVLLASVFAGRTYVWCAVSQQLCSAACEDDGCEDTVESGPAPALHTPCCTPQALERLPSGAQHDAPPAIPPALLAIRPPGTPDPRAVLFVRLASSGPLAHASLGAPRASRPPDPGERIAMLQVFRC